VQQIEALLGLRPLTTNVNLPNAGQLAGFPTGAIVESYAEFKHDRVQLLLSYPLPAGAACLVHRAVAEQSLTLSGALHNDKEKAFQALLADPLVHLPVDKAWAMFQEMIEATRIMLPGWE
jgi:alpha-galactosidase